MSGLLCLHGFGGAPAMWDGVLEQLPAPARATCVVLPGHQREPPIAGGFDATVEALAERIDPRDPAVVLGYSLGGRLGLALALRFAPRVRAAVLIGAHPGLVDPAERLERQRWEATQASRLQRDGVAAFMAAWEALPIFATQSPALREAQRAARHAHDAGGLAWAMVELGLGRMPPSWDELAALSRPLVLVTGELDAKFTALALRAEAASAHVRHIIAPGAGHNVALEAPAVVAAALAALL